MHRDRICCAHGLFLHVGSRSCMGCGRAIAAEFLGIKKDYSPCRFADGLFCRRYLVCRSLVLGSAKMVAEAIFPVVRLMCLLCCIDLRSSFFPPGFLDATRTVAPPVRLAQKKGKRGVSVNVEYFNVCTAKYSARSTSIALPFHRWVSIEHERRSAHICQQDQKTSPTATLSAPPRALFSA